MTTDHPIRPPPKVHFMPEIIDIVGRYLSPPNLFRCLQVCRAWSKLFIPNLYETIKGNRYSWHKFLENCHLAEAPATGKDEDWLLRLFTNHGHHLRNLEAGRCVLFNAIAASRTCTQLETLSISGSGYVPSRKDIARDHSVVWNSPPKKKAFDPPPTSCDWTEQRCVSWQWIYRLIQQNSGTLQALRIHDLSEFRTLAREDIHGMLAYCHSLTRLEIREWDTKLGQVDLQQLLANVPQLQHFVNRSLYWNDTLLKASLPQLISLQLLVLVPTQSLFQLLKKLPTLRDLRIRWDAHADSADTLGTVLGGMPCRLERLYIGTYGSWIDRPFATLLLPWLFDLVHFRKSHLGPLVAALILAHFQNLRTYRQMEETTSIHPSYQSFSAVNTMGLLLENCPHLTEFDGINHQIEADYLLAHLWVCKGLEVLRCQIVGVHRLSEEEEIDYRQALLFLRVKKRSLSQEERLAMEKHERLRFQQQLVYERLSEMANLKVLDLGKEYRHADDFRGAMTVRNGVNEYSASTGPIPNTLELSMVSGLGQLSTLKKLEVFGFEGVDHRIEERELRWMASSWPRLKVMRGLHSVKLTRVKSRPDDETTYLRRYMQKLRPRVKHEK